MSNITNYIGQLHAFHAFICVDAFVDGKRAGGSGTFMMVAFDVSCKQVLNDFLGKHAMDYFPLPESTIVVMMCVKNCDAIQLLQDCSVFLDFSFSMAMSEVPTKRFTFKCIRHVEARPPRQDPIVAMMALRNIGCLHLPLFRRRAIMTRKDELYNAFRKYLQDSGVAFPADLATSLGDEFPKHITYAFFPFEHERLGTNQRYAQ
jgi:hypothetical protein